MTQRARVVKTHECSKVVSFQRVSGTKRYELPKVANIKRYENQEARLAKGCMFQTVSFGTGLRLTRPIGSRPKAGSGKGVRWAIEPDSIGRSHLDSIRIGGLVFGDDPDLFDTVGKFIRFMIMLTEELRMVLVKPRSREGSVSERLCNVWLDDARDELVIVYETVKKLCIESHAGKSKSEKSRKSKKTAGQSSQVAMDGTNLSGLQTDPAAADTRDVLPTDQANLTGTQQDGQEHRESDEEVESSNANRDGDQHERVADGTANVPATLSKEDLLEAMKVMGTQVAAMAQLFTPLVNSSVGQATPVATTTPNTNVTSRTSKTVARTKWTSSSASSRKLGSVHSSSVPTKSAPLAGLPAHSAEAAESQLISARRTVRALGRWSGSGSVAGCWVLGQGCGLCPGGLGRGLGLWPTPNPIRKGEGMQVAERGQLLADGAHSLASRACSWGKTCPLVFYKYGGFLVDFIIQFQSKILREKRREKEREKERVPAKRKADCGGVVFRRL
ncbi:hypothetical protein IGI04_023464 [Brassica rapa subsp. trilocularis]|uniref:Uncharacterized protein n=1 Tax=Brassica rapa subsp. trilocularis TaxID=1813537 RepID=A0ABQ7M843_BRACM|nr:hypothetical protein IGI04_023464 [Brassica rapa subsp. trilocularis]